MSSEEAAGSTRERLLLAARRQIVGQGWQAASSRLVTGDAGVPLGSIRYHFGSREAMLVEAAMGEVQVMFATPWARVTAASTREELVEALIGWVAAPDSSAEQHALLLEVMAHSRRSPDLADALELALSGYRAAIADAIRRVTTVGSRASVELADSLAAHANGLWLQAVVEPRLDRALVSETARRTWMHALGG